jgi:hypothetical protein
MAARQSQWERENRFEPLIYEQACQPNILPTLFATINKFSEPWAIQKFLLVVSLTFC